MTASSTLPPPDHRKRNRLLIFVSLVFLFAALIWFLVWLFVSRFYAYTDDAYVSGNQVLLAPEIEGGISAIYTDETSFVKEGELLVEIEKSDFILRLEEKKAHLANQVRHVATLFKTVDEKRALVNVRRAELHQKRLDLSYREGLQNSGAISQQEYQESKTGVEVAVSYVTFAEKELEAALIEVQNTTVETHPLVQQAVFELKEAYLNLLRCRLLSPVTGIVAKRTAQVGQRVKIGDPLLIIVPLDYLWLDANYKETQLKRIRVGQNVTFTADIYGRSLTYHGKVLGLSPGTGAAFGLLPPQNASGNWIKIIQRLPVRISIDSEEIKKNPLFIGLSLRVDVDTHNLDGKMLQLQEEIRPFYTTPIYQIQQGEIDAIDKTIASIISQNC